MYTRKAVRPCHFGFKRRICVNVFIPLLEPGPISKYLFHENYSVTDRDSATQLNAQQTQFSNPIFGC